MQQVITQYDVKSVGIGTATRIFNEKIIVNVFLLTDNDICISRYSNLW